VLQKVNPAQILNRSTSSGWEPGAAKTLCGSQKATRVEIMKLSPQQFRQLGESFFEAGYNVLIPLLPRHGMADRKLENLSKLGAEELRACADTSVDIVLLTACSRLLLLIRQLWKRQPGINEPFFKICQRAA
jgi:hypothetical protein